MVMRFSDYLKSSCTLGVYDPSTPLYQSRLTITISSESEPPSFLHIFVVTTQLQFKCSIIQMKVKTSNLRCNPLAPQQFLRKFVFICRTHNARYNGKIIAKRKHFRWKLCLLRRKKRPTFLSSCAYWRQRRLKNLKLNYCLSLHHAFVRSAHAFLSFRGQNFTSSERNGKEKLYEPNYCFTFGSLDWTEADGGNT